MFPTTIYLRHHQIRQEVLEKKVKWQEVILTGLSHARLRAEAKKEG